MAGMVKDVVYFMLVSLEVRGLNEIYENSIVIFTICDGLADPENA